MSLRHTKQKRWSSVLRAGLPGCALVLGSPGPDCTSTGPAGGGEDGPGQPVGTRKTPGREESGVQRCPPRESLPPEPAGPERTAPQGHGPSHSAAAGKARRAEGERRRRGRVAGPTRGRDLRVCAGVVLRRLPRRLGVDAGDDMALGVSRATNSGSRHARFRLLRRRTDPLAALCPRRGHRRGPAARDARGPGLHSVGGSPKAALPNLTSPAPAFPPPRGRPRLRRRLTNHSGASAWLRLGEAPLRANRGDGAAPAAISQTGTQASPGAPPPFRWSDPAPAAVSQEIRDVPPRPCSPRGSSVPGPWGRKMYLFIPKRFISKDAPNAFSLFIAGKL